MEIEKKFTIKELPINLEQYQCIHIEQGYLCVGPVVRIRKADDKYILTYKAKTGVDENILHTKVNHEVELPLTEKSYEHLRKKIDGHLIVKERYVIPLDDGHKVELDIFHGHLEGLCFAEVEFSSIADVEKFLPPSWFAEDVSMDCRYANNYLSQIDHWV